MAIQKITGDVIATSAVTADSLADTTITAAKLHTTLDLTGKTVTVATASAGDNDTTVASTAFVSTAVSNLVDSSPDALNTLNELAAALGDDANFSTTVTNSIALKAPLASPTFTGNAVFDTSTLVVDATNNRVGIGTTSPANALEISTDGTDQLNLNRADASINTNNTLAGIVVSADDPTANHSGAKIGFTAGDNWTTNYFPTNIIFSNDASGTMTERMRIDSDGNVGIGASSALDNKLEVNGGDIRVRGTSTPSIKFNNADQEVVGIRLKSGASGVLSFHTDKMVIDSSGKVGIGTTNIPHGGVGRAKFAINGTNADAQGPHLQYTTDTDDYPVFQQLNWSHDNISLNFDSYFDGQWRSSDAGSNFQIYKNVDALRIKYDSGIAAGNEITWNDGFVIDTAGNVGIGATSISATDWGSASKILQIAGTQPLLSLKDTDATNGEFQIANSGQNLYFYDAASSATRMYINSSGNVGIGESNPQTKLHVYGTNPVIRVSDDGTSGYSTLELRQQNTANEGAELMYDSGTGHTYLNTVYNADLVFATNTGSFGTTSTNTRLTIKNDGVIEVGKSSVGTDRIKFVGNSNIFAPNIGDHTQGTRLSLYDAGATTWYAIGIESNHMWFNADGGIFKFYQQAVQKVHIDGTNPMPLLRVGPSATNAMRLGSVTAVFPYSGPTLIAATPGATLTIHSGTNSTGSWDTLNSSLPDYLAGTATFNTINTSQQANIIVYLNVATKVYLVRDSGWNSVDLTDWIRISDNTVYGSGSSRVYVRYLPAGTHSLDNDSALYFFEAPIGP
jgi:hypothetical protein